MTPEWMLTAFHVNVAILRNAFLSHRDDAERLARHWRAVEGDESWVVLRDVATGEIVDDWTSAPAPWNDPIDNGGRA